MPKGVYERRYQDAICWKCGITYTTVKKDTCYCPNCVAKGFQWSQREDRHEVDCEECGKVFTLARKPRSGHLVCPTCRNRAAKIRQRRRKRIRLLAGWKTMEYTQRELEDWYSVLTNGRTGDQ